MSLSEVGCGFCLCLDRGLPVTGYGIFPACAVWTAFLSQCGEFACLCPSLDGKHASVCLGGWGGGGVPVSEWEVCVCLKPRIQIFFSPRDSRVFRAKSSRALTFLTYEIIERKRNRERPQYLCSR